MTLYDDMMLLEEGADSEEDAMVAMQRVINNGAGWKMNGSMGRSMMAALDAGQCMLGEQGCHDYYGNYIPSRNQVKDGAVGSRDFVGGMMGEDWAKMLEAV